MKNGIVASAFVCTLATSALAGALTARNPP